jgi:molybdate transport system substrate-binding protein
MQLLRLLLLLLIAAPATARDAPPARVYAAASLTEAMTELADAYAATGRPRPLLVFAASSALARQIERGAPAGLFVSADADWVDYLAARRLVAGDRRVIAGNQLVLIVPRAQARQVCLARGFDLAAFVGPRGRWTTGDPAAVPVGRYAREALTSLGAWERAAPRLARAENVRSALAFVERGIAAAGIVYATDARASGRVAVAGVFPAASHSRIVYPAVLTRGAGAEARAFHAFLTSPEARAVLRARGFTRP